MTSSYGRPRDIKAENAGFQTVQDLTLTFDVLGRQTAKRD